MFYGQPVSLFSHAYEEGYRVFGSINCIAFENCNEYFLVGRGGKVRFSKEKWTHLICGDHVIVAMDSSRSLHTLSQLGVNYEGKITCELPVDNYSVSVDYLCKFGVACFSTSNGNSDFTKMLIFEEKDLLLHKVCELSLPYRVSSVACGKEHALFLDSSSQVYAIGSNYRGQLGIGGTELQKFNKPVFVDVLFGQDISLIAAGGWHNIVANNQSDAVFSWGWNECGQLGRDPSDCVCDIPSLLELEHSGSECLKIQKISCGSRHSLVVANDGNNNFVFTFGSNKFGQLGRPIVSCATDGFDEQFDWHPKSVEYVSVRDAFAFGYATVVINDG